MVGGRPRWRGVASGGDSSVGIGDWGSGDGAIRKLPGIRRGSPVRGRGSLFLLAHPTTGGPTPSLSGNTLCQSIPRTSPDRSGETLPCSDLASHPCPPQAGDTGDPGDWSRTGPREEPEKGIVDAISLGISLLNRTRCLPRAPRYQSNSTPREKQQFPEGGEAVSS